MMAAPLALSLGDPAGVGPEIVVKAWRALRRGGPAFVVVGDARSLSAAWGGEDPPIQIVADMARGAAVFEAALPILNRPLPAAVAGAASAATAGSIIGWIETAATLALAGEASGLVTAPIAKAPLYAAGFTFPGHTEFLGDLAPAPTGAIARGPVMMLAASDLRVSLVTIHEPLARVPGLLTRAVIVNAGLVTARALADDFGIQHPRLAVTGLNPHAGENGALGDEEIAIIAPAVRALRDHGVEASGPHPADSLFHAEARTTYDAALCMYHDQALIPVKMLDFWGGVNVTLGLPIVRTSPDHGVGFDIAGRGVARPDSLIAAIRMAAGIAA
ncbi:MAG: 4-hydroxythreonine-4-phosphate dehydrogenase PdxA, partial [Caulobacteraceae bacterium]|nr:4-hydroxythreonine-4-phosphate dehydrogenase PdxA [Caulobacteraceae bacterium]